MVGLCEIGIEKYNKVTQKMKRLRGIVLGLHPQVTLRRKFH